MSTMCLVYWCYLVSLIVIYLMYWTFFCGSSLCARSLSRSLARGASVELMSAEGSGSGAPAGAPAPSAAAPLVGAPCADTLLDPPSPVEGEGAEGGCGSVGVLHLWHPLASSS